MRKYFLIISLLLISTNILAQNCIEQFVDNMLVAYPKNNAKLLAELQKHWPTRYTKIINNNGVYEKQTHDVPKYSDTLGFINIGVVSASKLGKKIDKGKCLLPKEDYLCYYDYNKLVFCESIILSGSDILGCISKYQSKKRCLYEFSDSETIMSDKLYSILMSVKPDLVFRLSGQGNFIVYYVKNRQLMAICQCIKSEKSSEQYEILTYEECYEKYIKLPFFYFGEYSRK